MNRNCDVTVLGLGSMGSALANTLISCGYTVAVWNRTASRVDSFVREGAVPFKSAGEAISASQVTIMCVIDYDAADNLLTTENVESQLRGRTLVQLSTGKLKQVSSQSERIRGLGGHFIAGGIMASPSRVGDENCMVLFAGDPIFSEYQTLLMCLGGASRYLGDDPVRAIGTYFTLGSFLTASQCMFYEGAAMARYFGVDIETFLKLANVTINELASEVRESAEKIAGQAYEQSLGTVNTYRYAMLDVEQSLKTTGAQPRIVRAAIEHMEDAVMKGFGDKDIASLVEAISSNNRPQH